MKSINMLILGAIFICVLCVIGFTYYKLIQGSKPAPVVQIESAPRLSDEISDVDYKLLKRYLTMNPDTCDELIKESFADEIITYEENHAIFQCIGSKIDRTDKQDLIDQHKGK